jgi:hypothetical protein
MYRHLALLFTLFSLSFLSLAHADLDEAKSAYERGDYAKAYKELKVLAGQGNAKAQYQLGVMYSSGEGVTKDCAETVKWWRQAAQQGLVQAQLNLGVFYHTGQCVARDYVEAVKWYRQAAEQGLPQAQFNLGVMHARGEGITRDYAEALKWYRQAAEQGHAKAQYNLGLMYEKGYGVEQDYVQAHMWCSLAAARGFAYAEKARDKVAANMTPSQIAEAQRLCKDTESNIKSPALMGAKIPDNTFAGGDGSSIEQAVIIKQAKNSFEAIPLERLWIGDKCPGFKKVKQSLVERNGRKYDVIRMRCGGEEETEVYFDITDCFGLGTKQ